MKAPQKMIIDGYNVVYTDERLRRMACKDLRSARERLIDMLRDYLGERGIRATIVFDGQGGIADAQSVVPGKLQVMFSAGGETADELILSTICQASNPRGYIVVTSDMAHIGREARELGCEVIGSKRFLDRVTTSLNEVKSTRVREQRREFGNTEYWLDQFDQKDDKSQDQD